MNDGVRFRRDSPRPENAKLANMNRMILPLLLLSCLTFGGGCASERPRDIQTYNANLNRLKIGMTTKKVSALVGPPIRSEHAATAAGTIVEWYYVESQFMTGQRGIKVTFTNGRVSSIQSASATP
jgi:outer membrane protein assembly factor BamE (lipoprotein component of BamABCDE complex)